MKDIRQLLKLLFKDFDKTYVKIFFGIDDSYRQVAVTALQWLAFSKQPLTIAELVEAAVIDSQAEMAFDSEDRFQNPDDILIILSTLVTADSKRYSKAGVTVKLAHFSVKEYLVSQQIHAGSANKYSIREIEAHETIANVCLVYLSQFRTIEALISLDNLDGFPLLKYAAMFWFEHA